jgi:RND family efflux transporter MFP subunit
MKNAFTAKLPPIILSLLVYSPVTVCAKSSVARLDWVKVIELRTLQSGVVDIDNARLGQHVEKGTILMALQQDELDAKLAKITATIKQEKLGLSDNDDKLKRAEELYDRGLIADQELKDAKLAVASSKAKIASLEAAQTIARIAKERSILLAPISGIVVEKNAWKGSVINKIQSKPLIAIAPDRRMLAKIQVTANDLHKYKTGQPVKIKIRGKLYPGKIYRIGVKAVRIDLSGAIYEVDILFSHKPEDALRPSQSVEAILP